MTNSIGLMIECLVAALLVVTIVYCMLLNRRLKRLKADEMSLKATISELITATEIAERAVAGLKVTVRECDQDIGERLRAAEKFSADIDGQLKAGEELLTRLTRIASASRPAPTPVLETPMPLALTPVAPQPAARTAIPTAPVFIDGIDAHAILLAAQAFTERARARAAA